MLSRFSGIFWLGIVCHLKMASIVKMMLISTDLRTIHQQNINKVTIARVSVETIAKNEFYGQILQDMTEDAVERLVSNINNLNRVESGPFNPAVNVILSIIEICLFSMFKVDYFHFKTNDIIFLHKL